MEGASTGEADTAPPPREAKLTIVGTEGVLAVARLCQLLSLIDPDLCVASTIMSHFLDKDAETQSHLDTWPNVFW